MSVDKYLFIINIYIVNNEMHNIQAATPSQCFLPSFSPEHQGPSGTDNWILSNVLIPIYIFKIVTLLVNVRISCDSQNRLFFIFKIIEVDIFIKKIFWAHSDFSLFLPLSDPLPNFFRI